MYSLTLHSLSFHCECMYTQTHQPIITFTLEWLEYICKVWSMSNSLKSDQAKISTRKNIPFYSNWWLMTELFLRILHLIIIFRNIKYITTLYSEIKCHKNLVVEIYDSNNIMNGEFCCPKFKIYMRKMSIPVSTTIK